MTGQMLKNRRKPLGLAGGGLIEPLCPTTPSAADLDKAKEKGGAEGLAAEIKASEGGAKARRAALRYLGTVDCQRWPEAQGAVADGLRADPNECVRWEAALAMGSGCCCTKKTIA